MSQRASTSTTAEPDETAALNEVPERSGRRIVGVVYLVAVAVAGTMGYLLGTVGIEGTRSVDLFFLIPLPPTGPGLAIFGMGTLGVGLGIGIVVVMYVSRHFDDVTTENP